MLETVVVRPKQLQKELVMEIKDGITFSDYPCKSAS